MPRSYEETGLVRAQAKAVRSSARKARVVLEKIRGKRVADATAILTFSPRAVSRDIELVLRSAVSNAEANHGLAAEDLVIATATADEGVTMKRWQPRARGRAMRIRKRTTHITVTLKQVAGSPAAPSAATRRRAATAAPAAPAAPTEAAAGLGATAVAPVTGAAAGDAPEDVTADAPTREPGDAAETTEAAAGLGAVTLSEAGPEQAGPATPEASSDSSADAPAEGADDQAAAAPSETTSTDQPAEGDRETVEADLDDPTTTNES
jgi:large subunit ribosomal protein L22